MIKQLNACLEQKCEQFDHDESACFEQFVDEVVKARDLIESESLDDRKNFRFRDARRTLDRIEIEEFRNVDQIDR
jgi:phosphomevalonate kinase